MPQQRKTILRRIKPEDASALVAFYNGLSEASKRTFRPLGSTTQLADCEAIIQENRPESGKKFDLVAVRGTRIVGWSFLWELKSEEPTFGLGIADAHQGKGLGGALMDRVMKAARERGLRKVFLTAVKDNEVAWKMYEKRGFVRYGEYYDSKDALHYLRMAAELERSMTGRPASISTIFMNSSTFPRENNLP